jgi:hypothetical protein
VEGRDVKCNIAAPDTASKVSVFALVRLVYGSALSYYYCGTGPKSDREGLMTEREDRLRAAAERVAEEIAREDIPDFVEMLLNILCWQAVQGYDERCVKYNELVRDVIAHIEKETKK